ncbi:MAG: putative transporter ATP-binding protein YbhF [Planctomycetota bacterium]|jgi:ABC-2 type transport system ATP-binding protein
MTTAIDVRGVTKTYDELTAVNDVSLTLQRGTVMGLIGPNGAGKTSLLRMISTLSLADSGEVLVEGFSVRRAPREVRRRLGFMPAEFGCPRGVTIGEYLEYFCCLYGLSEWDRRQRIRDVCELTELRGREETFVSGLSTGNRQRLLLAKTLLHDPSVLILDEPASGLDPRARMELRAIIRTLASLGKAVLISSHILPDIEDVSDAIGIMEAGRLVLQGDLAQLQRSAESTQQQVRLRVPAGQQEAAMEALRRLSEVTECRMLDDELRVVVHAADASCVLEALLRERIRVVYFAENTGNLEEIFLRSTAGNVT